MWWMFGGLPHFVHRSVITLGMTTIRKGHWVMFLIGISSAVLDHRRAHAADAGGGPDRVDDLALPVNAICGREHQTEDKRGGARSARRPTGPTRRSRECEPRALVARLRRAGHRTRGRSSAAAPRPGRALRHRGREPRRVLLRPRRRAASARRSRRGGDAPRRPRAGARPSARRWTTCSKASCDPPSRRKASVSCRSRRADRGSAHARAGVRGAGPAVPDAGQSQPGCAVPLRSVTGALGRGDCAGPGDRRAAARTRQRAVRGAAVPGPG